MKRTLVIFAHPYLEHSHSNRELMNFYERHQHYTFRDLYEDYPDFHVAPFRERKRLGNFDRLIFHFPLIWFGLPPLLKLWIDEVLDREWLKDATANPMRGKEVFILVTVNSEENLFGKEARYGFSVEELISSLIVPLRALGAEIRLLKTVFEAEKLSKKEIIRHKLELIAALKN